MHIPYTNIMKKYISSSAPSLSNTELSIQCNYALLHYITLHCHISVCGCLVLWKSFVVLQERVINYDFIVSHIFSSLVF